MKEFMGKDFLLGSEAAEKLFFDYAQKLPVIDYHCHLKPSEIAEDKRYDSITEVWLGGDHYKWRAMRGAGVEERCITGDADPYEKFLAWSVNLLFKTLSFQNKNSNKIWLFARLFVSLQPITQLLTKLWTITRRTITICKGGGWRARLLIPLPLKPFHERKKD